MKIQARESNHGNDPSSGRAHEYSEQLADLKGKVTAAEQQSAGDVDRHEGPHIGPRWVGDEGLEAAERPGAR